MNEFYTYSILVKSSIKPDQGKEDSYLHTLLLSILYSPFLFTLGRKGERGRFPRGPTGFKEERKRNNGP